MSEIEGDKPAKKRFKSCPIGYFHVDIAKVQTAEGKLHLFVAIDRTSKFALTELHPTADKMTAAQFLRNVINAVPYTIHTVLTDNGIQFTTAAQTGMPFSTSSIESATTTASNTALPGSSIPGPTSSIERMNRTIRESTVKRFHYDDHAQLRKHLDDFISAYNFGRRLKTLKGPNTLRIHLQTVDIRA